MIRYRFAWLAGALALAGLPAPGNANGNARDLEVTLRLSDDSFCPGGRMWGPEGAEEGRDDQVWASVSLRSTTSRPVYLRGEKGELTVRDESGRVVSRQAFSVAGSFTRTARRIEYLRFRPSQEPGRYTVSVWVVDGTVRDSARFAVDYDRAACPAAREPRPEVVVRIPPVRIPIPTLPPRPWPRPERELQESLKVSLRVAWSCQDKSERFDTATVTVYNTDSTRPIRVAGIGTHGLTGLGPMNAVNRQPGWLRPGEHITFHARGQLAEGQRRVVAYVSNYPAVRDGRTIRVDCRGWMEEPCWTGLPGADKS
jgi:hypothetical protein